MSWFPGELPQCFDPAAYQAGSGRDNGAGQQQQPPHGQPHEEPDVVGYPFAQPRFSQSVYPISQPTQSQCQVDNATTVADSTPSYYHFAQSDPPTQPQSQPAGGGRQFDPNSDRLPAPPVGPLAERWTMLGDPQAPPGYNPDDVRLEHAVRTFVNASGNSLWLTINDALDRIDSAAASVDRSASTIQPPAFWAPGVLETDKLRIADLAYDRLIVGHEQPVANLRAELASVRQSVQHILRHIEMRSRDSIRNSRHDHASMGHQRP